MPTREGYKYDIKYNAAALLEKHLFAGGFSRQVLARPRHEVAES